MYCWRLDRTIACWCRGASLCFAFIDAWFYVSTLLDPWIVIGCKRKYNKKGHMHREVCPFSKKGGSRQGKASWEFLETSNSYLLFLIVPRIPLTMFTFRIFSLELTNNVPHKLVYRIGSIYFCGIGLISHNSPTINRYAVSTQKKVHRMKTTLKPGNTSQTYL
jgi:hypothetical protein